MNNDRKDIEAVLQTYFDGVYEDDPKKFASVLHACFHMFSVTDGTLNDVSRTEWIERMGARPSPQARNLSRYDWVITVDQSGPTTAFAKVHCQIPPRFTTVHIFLLNGDLRTVHFSVGSGTRMALEDAIILVQAFAAHQDVGRWSKGARRP